MNEIMNEYLISTQFGFSAFLYVYHATKKNKNASTAIAKTIMVRYCVAKANSSTEAVVEGYFAKSLKTSEMLMLAEFLSQIIV
jgi:hypothetical protein